MALESAVNVESIYKTVYQGEGTDISLIDKIPEKKDEQENLLNRIFLEELLGELKSEERQADLYEILPGYDPDAGG